VSRGPGHIQRQVLEYLDKANGEPRVLIDITEGLFGRRALSPPTRAQVESVRRALKALAAERAVVLFYIAADSRADTPRRQLAAMLD
jgi:hypothetical protein